MNQKSYSLISDSNMGFPPHHHPFLFSLHQDNNDHLPSPSSLHPCPPQLFPGSGGGHDMMKRSMSFSGMERCDQEGVHGDMDDLSDDGSNLGEKKKRLNLEQVKALEKSFELGNKLEPERKIQLAKALGLQPRQIAIWFQNRRARWKTKQLEKDYEVLKKQFDSLKADNDNLQSQNKKLHAELQSLKGSRDSTNEGSNPKKEAEGTSWSNGSDQNSCDVNLDISRNISRTASPPPPPPPPNNNNNNNNSQELSTRHLFSSPSSNVRPTATTNMTQLFHGSSRSSVDHHHHLAVHHQDHHPENFSSMFINGIEEQQGLIWAWPDQNQQQNTTFSLSQPQFTNN